MINKTSFFTCYLKIVGGWKYCIKLVIFPLKIHFLSYLLFVLRIKLYLLSKLILLYVFQKTYLNNYFIFKCFKQH